MSTFRRGRQTWNDVLQSLTNRKKGASSTWSWCTQFQDHLALETIPDFRIILGLENAAGAFACQRFFGAASPVRLSSRLSQYVDRARWGRRFRLPTQRQRWCIPISVKHPSQEGRAQVAWNPASLSDPPACPTIKACGANGPGSPCWRYVPG